MDLYSTDTTLISAFRAGDTYAIRRIYDLFYRPLCYYAEKLVGQKQQAEDIVIDVFIKLLNKKTDFSNLRDIKSFLYTATRNSSIDYLRSEKRHHGSHQEILYISEHTAPAADLHAIQAEVMQELYREIENLPPQCGQVFKMILFGGYSTEQIASELQISVKTVLNQKSRAIKQLRMALLKKDMLPALFILLF